MKQSKKAVYAKHGIIYDPKTGKIWFPLLQIWICELLKQGNSKTGKRVYTWSLPAGKDGTCICNCSGCYAMTGFYQMDSVKNALALNQYIIENDVGFFYKAVSAQLEIIGSGEIRIHASGDFNTRNSLAYATTWKVLVSENPDCLFWTYTKMREYETLFDDLENGNIVKSVINGIGINYGHCGYIMMAYRKLKSLGANVYICRCGIDKNQHCERCGHCGKADFVLFIEHSTDYKAEDDPDFPELVRLIESQGE